MRFCVSFVQKLMVFNGSVFSGSYLEMHLGSGPLRGGNGVHVAVVALRSAAVAVVPLHRPPAASPLEVVLVVPPAAGAAHLS